MGLKNLPGLSQDPNLMNIYNSLEFEGLSTVAEQSERYIVQKVQEQFDKCLNNMKSIEQKITDAIDTNKYIKIFVRRKETSV